MMFALFCSLGSCPVSFFNSPRFSLTLLSIPWVIPALALLFLVTKIYVYMFPILLNITSCWNYYMHGGNCT
ncbi:hypothetical protein A4A49_26097 [Nicotiana attenuata]|uniref:Uncharacterized protein n=1 Tax=Nicotiana attenuata TaxID=49451 RepID=A0A314KK62_NICAT|nr:hypothetical protein A4A49_26097 [Nicotiana attenuata]